MLNDREHVEGVAIMRRFVEMVESGEFSVDDAAMLGLLETAKAGRQWLMENHPAPSAYIGALTPQSVPDETERGS